MATEKWAGWTSRGTVLGTELNSIANTARTDAGTAVDNATNKDRWGKLELVVNFTAGPSSTAYVEIYMVTAPNGTDYDNGSSSVDPGTHKLIDRIPVRPVTGTQRLSGRMFPLEPAPTKFLLRNVTDQAFPASGSTLSLYTTNVTMVS